MTIYCFHIQYFYHIGIFQCITIRCTNINSIIYTLTKILLHIISFRSIMFEFCIAYELNAFSDSCYVLKALNKKGFNNSGR